MKRLLIVAAMLTLFPLSVCLGDGKQSDSSETESPANGKLVSEAPDQADENKQQKTEKDGEKKKQSEGEGENQGQAATEKQNQERLAPVPRPKRKKPFTFRMNARGFATLTYQVGSRVQGSTEGRQVFRNEYFGLTQGFSAYGSIGVEWDIGRLRLKGEYSPFSYSPSARQFQAEYDAGPAKALFGNLPLSLEGNTFVSFSRYAQGIRIDHQLGKGSSLTVLTFETPTDVTTDVIQGTNSPGPYFLSRTPVLEGSEQVRLDERPLRRGLDYMIDYASGFITFVTPIPTTSKIAVSYESASTGGVGRFIGSRAALRVGPNSVLGITYLSQKVPLTREVGARRRRDEFIGDGSVGPFQLMARPVAVQSERVFVDGLPQIAGVHYQINYQSGLLTFLRPVRAGALVAVEYEQSGQTQKNLGLLSMVGLDWAGEVRTIGRLSVQYGLSRGGDQAGDAIEIALGRDTDTIGYSLRWRRIQPGFQRIENPDFFRNEDGLSADLRWQVAPFLSLVTRWQSGRSTGARFFGVGEAALSSISRNRDFGIQLDFSKKGLPRLQISRQLLSSGFGGPTGGSQTQKVLTSLYSGYQSGHWSIEGAWEGAEDSFSSPRGGDEGTVATRTSTARRRVSVNFRPGSTLQLGADWNENTARGSQQFQSDSVQKTVRLSYSPAKGLDIGLSLHQLTGASSVSSILVGNVLSGVAGGTVSSFGYGGGGGYGWGLGSSHGGLGAGYGTFGIGVGFRPSGSGVGVAGRPTGGWSQPAPETVGADTWLAPSRRRHATGLSRQAPLPVGVSGNETTARMASLMWTPSDRIQVSFDWTATADKGSGYVAPSRQRDLGLTGAFTLTRDWNAYAQFSRSRTSYLDQLNETLTLVGSVGLTFGRYTGWNGSLNFQRLKMQSLRLVGKVPQLDESAFGALSLSLQVPIGKKWTLRLRGSRLKNDSPSPGFGAGYRVDEAEAVLEYQIVRGIGFGANWTMTRRKGARPEQNYSASVLRAQLSMGF